MIRFTFHIPHFSSPFSLTGIYSNKFLVHLILNWHLYHGEYILMQTHRSFKKVNELRYLNSIFKKKKECSINFMSICSIPYFQSLDLGSEKYLQHNTHTHKNKLPGLAIISGYLALCSIALLR